MSDPLKLSYSKLTTYSTCQRKYYWSYIKKIQPQGRQMPLEFGSAWHLAMEAWHGDKSGLEGAIRAFNGAFQDRPGEVRRTQAVAKRMLTLYTQRYEVETFSVLKQESALEIPVEEFLYVMKIDKVINEDGVVKGMEHKTTSSLGYHYLKSFKPNLQIAGYIKGLREKVDPRIDTMLIDIALVSIREPRDGERFMRYPERVDQWELDEATNVIVRLGREIAAKGEGFDAYVPNWNACTLYGECPFRQLCLAPASAREAITRMQYQPKEER